MATPVLKFKRGKLVDLPSLNVGEPGFTTDKYDLYVGSDAGNKFVGSGRFWSTETASAGSAVNLFEATANGTNTITLSAPTSVASNVTYYFPATQGSSNTVLTNDGSGNLTWGAGSTSSVLTGITTIQGQLDIEATSDISGIATFTNTTDNTLGNVDTGAVQIDGGVGIAKNLTVGAAASITADFYVVGLSTFEGAVEFRGGTISLGDADTDNIVLGGEINSHIIPNTDDTFDLGSSSKEWRNLYVDGHAELDNVNISGVSTFVGVATFTSSNVFIDNQLYVGGLEITGGAIVGADITTRNLSVSGLSTFTGQIDGNGGANISGGESTLSSATVSDLTSGRVVLAGTSGALEDSGNLTFNGTTLTATALSVTGAVDLGDQVTDTVTVTGRFDSSLIPLSDDAVDLGASGNQWRHLFVDGIADVDDLNVSGIATITDVNVGGATTIAGKLDVNGGADISGGETTLSSATVSDLTSGRVVLAGTSGALTDSGDLTFGSNLLTVVNTIDVTTLEATNLKAKDGTTAITIADSTGNVSCASSLTVTGNLTVLGAQTIVNTETLKVEDSLIEIGLVNSGGDLVAPSTDANIDVGVLFHYHNGSAAKKAGVFWDDSLGRIVVGSDLSESSSVMSATTYGQLMIGGLFVSDCQDGGDGTAVISCTGSTRNLENITIDGGTFT